MITKDKVFIITGASAGIGSELAYQLAEKGAHIVCAARTMTKLETVCKNIEDKGGSAIPIQADISLDRPSERTRRRATEHACTGQQYCTRVPTAADTSRLVGGVSIAA